MTTFFHCFALVFALCCSAVACSRPDFSQTDKPAPSAVSAPQLPQWARSFEGKRLDAIGTRTNACAGYFDGAVVRFSGARPGAAVVGWGWDSAAKRAVSRVLITDANMLVVGAGDGGIVRADVPKVMAAVTSPNTGWHGVVHTDAGVIYAWELSPTRRLCTLGHVTL